MSDKPREWWIDKSTLSIRPIPGTPHERNSIHVIEKSAYDALAAELAAERERADACSAAMKVLKNEVEWLQDMVTELEEKLK